MSDLINWESGHTYGEMISFSANGRTIELFAEDEIKEEVTANVAKYPIEHDAPIADHVQYDHKDMNFTGLVTGDNLSEANDKYGQMMFWSQLGTLVKIRGAWTLDNMLITNITKARKDGRLNVFEVTLTLTEVRLPSTSWTKRQNLGVKVVPQPPGLYVTVVWGNTYWGWWRQYGTPIQTLRDWNHYPDRFIPVGVRVRVR